MAHSHLRGWTPVSFQSNPEPTIAWADLRDYRFQEPFLDNTVEKAKRNESYREVQTGLDALSEMDCQPSLDPCLIIAHASRCGSTLLSALTAVPGGVIAVREPSILTDLLVRSPPGAAEFPTDEIVRMTARALGRIRFGDERHYVLKLNSAMTYHLPRLRQAFPKAPVVWLQRRPAEIVASNLLAPGRWMGDARGLEPAELARRTLHKLAAGFLAATALVDDATLVLDYRDLPEAAWTLVAPLMGVTPTAEEIDRMRQVATLHSKTGRPFTGESPVALPDPVRAMIAQALDPLYQALDRRRRTRAAT